MLATPGGVDRGANSSFKRGKLAVRTNRLPPVPASPSKGGRPVHEQCGGIISSERRGSIVICAMISVYNRIHAILLRNPNSRPGNTGWRIPISLLYGARLGEQIGGSAAGRGGGKVGQAASADER